MRRVLSVVLAMAGLMAIAPAALAQRPYIGFVYPAGGQQGTTFQIRLGGQGTDEVNGAFVTGSGVTAKIIENRRRLGNTETTLLGEQLRILKKAIAAATPAPVKPGSTAKVVAPVAVVDEATRLLAARIENRLAEAVQRPACSAISSLVIVEITIASDAEPGRREITLSTSTGVSNPLAFHVGQFPEVLRKPMVTAEFQVLGKENLALRKRPADEAEQRIKLPSTLNGQIASGEVNSYRFEARKGQKLVMSVEARQLNPFVADAVPGWFQPVMALYDAHGKEVAYNDDYRFKPDPVILHEVQHDGEMVLTITDAIYRGREDFVYRISVGELPFLTSIFPLGGPAGAAAKVEMKGWNLQGAKAMMPAADAAAGVNSVAASKDGIISNRVRFELDALPEALDKEPNNDAPHAQKVTLPVIINGRIDKADDWDVFMFAGKAGQTIVADVSARRLDSPLDSTLKITDSSGKVLAFNDDHEDFEAGINTQDADSYVMVTLPADGNYFVHLADASRHGGEEYAYRLRISQPQPDFALRLVPSSMSMRSKATGSIAIQALRKDGFTGPIKLALKDAPAGFSAVPVVMAANQTTARLAVKTDLVDTKQPVALCVEGRATAGDRNIVHCAVPAEDRMQAFLWRHLVPAEEFKVMVFDPSYQPPPKRVARVYPPAATQPATQTTTKPATTTAAVDPSNKQKFSKQQVASRLRQLKLLFEDGMITDDFYHEKVVECDAAR